MSVTLNPIQNQNLSSVAAALADGTVVANPVQSNLLGDVNVKVSETPLDLDALLARMRIETNEAKLEATRKRLTSALMQIAGMSEEHKAKVEEMKSAGEELIAAEQIRDAAREEFEANKDVEGAKEKYEASEKVVAEKRSRFDALIDSLDMASRITLCETLRLGVPDVDHLQDEIDEKDKMYSLSVARSVEDVISDSLKRLDGKMVSEVEERHQNHI